MLIKIGHAMIYVQKINVYYGDLYNNTPSIIKYPRHYAWYPDCLEECILSVGIPTISQLIPISPFPKPLKLTSAFIHCKYT